MLVIGTYREETAVQCRVLPAQRGGQSELSSVT